MTTYTGPVPLQPVGANSTAEAWERWLRYQAVEAQFAIAAAQDAHATASAALARAIAAANGIPVPPAPEPVPEPEPIPPVGPTPAQKALVHINAALSKLRELAIISPANPTIPRIAADLEQAKAELA